MSGNDSFTETSGFDDTFNPYDSDTEEVNQFFWSLVVVPGKRYVQELPHDLHVNHVSLGEDAKENSLSVLYCETEDGKQHPICRLREGKTDQMSLSLFFPSEEKLQIFSSKTSATIHLLGYCEERNSLDDDDEDSDNSEEEEKEENEEEVVEQKQGGKKRKAEAPPQQEPPAPKKAKDKKKSAITASAPNLSLAKEEKKAEPKTPKKETKKDAKKETKKEAPTPKKEPKKDDLGVTKKLAMGVVATVTQAGRGTVVARDGKKLKIQYRGSLQKGGKVFDSGKIDFRLGVGEVIKGWDIGVSGMKIGEKRTLIIPAAAGYGKRGSPPDIPPHATLKFDVTLLNVQ
jgi:FK506-binding nuclear protein